jgi:glycogen operon protein
MVVHGDELGRSQQGNNNAYCHDSPLSWTDWETADQPLIEFLAAVSALRREHPTFRRNRFFDGRPVRRSLGQPLPDIVWLNTDGSEMVPEDWDNPLARALGVFYNGDAVGKDRRNRPLRDHHFLLYCNSGDSPVAFKLPGTEYSHIWEPLIDTAGERVDQGLLSANGTVKLGAKSLLVLRAYAEPTTKPDNSVAASVASLINPTQERKQPQVPRRITG